VLRARSQRCFRRQSLTSLRRFSTTPQRRPSATVDPRRNVQPRHPPTSPSPTTSLAHRTPPASTLRETNTHLLSRQTARRHSGPHRTTVGVQTASNDCRICRELRTRSPAGQVDAEELWTRESWVRVGASVRNESCIVLALESRSRGD